MELKVWVEGIQRIVCGVTDKTTCQDVVYALAHATGKTGRFTLIERWRNNERLLAPQEHPLKVLQKWGEYSHDVQFIFQRSALEGAKGGVGGDPRVPKAKVDPPAAVWKPPPPQQQQHQIHPLPAQHKAVATTFADHTARLSPDSGRGSDRTGGSDTSNNGLSDKDYRQQQQHPTKTSQPVNGYRFLPPAYRPPPGPGQSHVPGYVQGHAPGHGPGSSSPADFPPPYRNPPPPPPGSRYANPSPTMLGAAGGRMVSQQQAFPVVRPPHYSPPPTHRTTHLSRHPSRSSLMGVNAVLSGQVASRMNQHGLPSRQHAAMPSSRVRQSHFKQGVPPPTDLAELVSLVSAQQSTLYSQQAEIKQCDAETSYLETTSTSSSSSLYPHTSSATSSSAAGAGMASAMMPSASESQIDLVLSEVKRLEDVAQRNEDELGALVVMDCSASGASKDDVLIKNEISQLKQRLAGTDHELQKTNHTLRRLGDDMRSMSMEKNRQRELELRQEIERLQNEIKVMQKSSEDGANLSHQLSKEVKEVEEQISHRKAEVEKLIKDMRDANMESLAISPPEESKQFLDGPMKPGTSRKMMGSPRALESAVPTAKNPHGVWV